MNANAVVRGLNISAIENALRAAPLATSCLVSDKGLRCAVGALLHGIGVDDDALSDFDAVSDGVEECALNVWMAHGAQLRAAYGFESARHIEDVILVNDGTRGDVEAIFARCARIDEELHGAWYDTL